MARLRAFMARRGLWVLGLLGVLVVADLGYALWETSYNPGFCNVCHIIRPYVTSYRTSSHLDNLHSQANVGCKECHRVSPLESARELVAYVTVNYDNPIRTIDLPMEDCLRCHRSYESLAERTSHLEPNPHNSHFGEIECTMCHHSHQESTLFCEQCHTWDLTPP